MKHWTIDDIRTANAVRGGHFFSKGALKFFKSRVSDTVYQGIGGIYFVTSERFDNTTRRGYTVRAFNPETGNINTVGERMSLTRYAATARAKELAAGNVKPEAFEG